MKIYLGPIRGCMGQRETFFFLHSDLCFVARNFEIASVYRRSEGVNKGNL